MPRLASRLAAAAALVLPCCARSLDVPPLQPPRVAAVEPQSGFAGARVTVSGSGFGGAASQVQVRFGASAATRPLAVAADGTSLTARVPDDATTGPVSVVTGVGEAASAADFAWRGLGRLRYRRAGVRADLPPAFDRALPGGSRGQVLLWSREVRRLAWLDEVGVSWPIPAAQVRALAASQDLQRVGVLSSVDLPCSPQPCRLADATLRLYDRPGLELLREGKVQPLKAVTFRATALLTYAELALDADGAHAMVVAYEGGSDYSGWALDLAAGSARAFQGKQQPDSSFGWTGLAWLGGSRWATADGLGVQLLDAAAPDPVGAFLPALQADPDIPEELVAIGGDGAGRLAVGGTQGSLILLQADGAGLREVGRARAPGSADSSEIDWIAFSKNGLRAAAVLPAAGMVDVFDLTDPAPAPLAAVALARPGAVSPDGAGGFLVPSPGEVALLSQASGAALSQRRIDARLHVAGLRLASCPDVSPSGPVEVLEVLDLLLHRVRRLHPTSLAELGCPALALPAEGSRIVDAVTARDAGLLLVGTADARVHRYGPGDLAPAGGAWRAPDADGEGSFGIISLHATGEGRRVLAAVTLAGAPDGATRALYLLNPAAAWSDRQASPRLPLPIGTNADWLFLGDRLAVLDEHTEEVRLYDAGAAAGASWPKVGAAPLATGVRQLAAAGRALVFVDGAAPPVLSVFAAADGAPAGTSVVRGSGQLDLAPPGGRRLDWWHSSRDGCLLVSQELDPETGALGQEESAVAVPFGYPRGFWYPDGERRLAVERSVGTLLLLE